MPKPYKMTRRDATLAWLYLQRKIKAGDFPENNTAVATRNFPEAVPKVLQSWCDDYLSPGEYRKMRAAIRQDKSRLARRDQNRKTVTLSYRAWSYATELAERDGSTISDVLEKYLYRAIRRPGRASSGRRRQ